VSPRENKVKTAIKRHPAMVCENQTDGCLPWQNGTPKNPQTRWMHKGTGVPPPQGVPPRPGMPPVPSDDDESSETAGVPPTNVNIHTPLPSAQFVPRIACVIKILFQIC
jgi:hypothetical protein